MEFEPMRFSSDQGAGSNRVDTPLREGGDAGSDLGPSHSPVRAELPEHEESSTLFSGNNGSAPKLDPTGDTSRSQKKRGTFELKFLIAADRATEIMAWARQYLDADPHADPQRGDGYRVNSLYLDTPQFDVFHRMEGFRQQKYRLRRYGRESLVWFEQKRKRKGLVRKRRVSVHESDISSRLIHPVEAEWDGTWFRNKLDEQRLTPVCQVTYERFARVKTTEEGLIRLTIDDRLTARAANGWDVPSGPLDGVSLLDERKILELKFRDAMPVLFRRLIEDQKLQLTSFSKYRTSVEECIPRDILAGPQSGESADA